jgi:hypothetical protein
MYKLSIVQNLVIRHLNSSNSAGSDQTPSCIADGWSDTSTYIPRRIIKTRLLKRKFSTSSKELCLLKDGSNASATRYVLKN